MLVLSRKRSESVVIDENIVVTVIEVRGDKVRLGIQAPRDVPVHRSEILASIQQTESIATTESAPANENSGQQ